ncbi:MAG TPA: ABC transporter permease [Steroidobacteraceae bacterium]|nr:ABC transporter permease [Steroidobacteraceae bacterium]
MVIPGLALRSLWNRRGTALLTVFSVAVSVALLLGVEKIRTETRASFANTISGADLIVGARSGALNLLLYSIFRIGDATNNVSWATYRKIADHPDVAWTIPLSLGDSHRGHRVVGTTTAYFEHYRYARTRELAFAAGRPFAAPDEAVLGAEVARVLGYEVGTAITIAHGIGEVSFAPHDDHPFRVVGILAPTGTPVDRSVHVSLEAIEAIHLDWQSGMRLPGARPDGAAGAPDLTPTAITAFIVGLDSPIATFQMQRAINQYREEPLLAVMPGVALQQLWDLVGVAERALLIVAGFVVLAGLLGMLTAILTTLNERRREMAILRSVGAKPRHVFALFVTEAALLALAGIALGIALVYALLAIARPLLAEHYGIFIAIGGLTRYDLSLLAVVLTAAVVMGAVPAWRAYRVSLADGLSIRI